MARVGEVGVVVADAVLRDRRVAALVGVVDEEPAVVGVLGMEREPEQPALAAGRDGLRDVEEWLVEQRPVLDHADPAALFDHEQPSCAIAGVRRARPGCSGR